MKAKMNLEQNDSVLNVPVIINTISIQSVQNLLNLVINPIFPEKNWINCTEYSEPCFHPS